MARVFYDGQRIFVDVARLDEQKVSSLAEYYGAEYFVEFDCYAFNRNANAIMDIAKLEGALFDPSFEDLYKRIKVVYDKKIEQRQEEIKALNLPECLYPFQKEAVCDMLKNQRNILLASDMGCGKSAMSLTYMAKRENSYPALIVCPASLKVNWSVEVAKWTPDKTCYIINGRDSYNDSYVLSQAKKADILIINYDILGVDDKEASKREKERIKIAKENGWKYRKAFVPVKGWAVVFNEQFNLRTIICDECQYIESLKAIRSRAVIQIATNENIKKVFLSGTPFETRVAQFYNACHILAPDLFPKESDFLWRYCDPHYNGFGWEYKGLSNVEELRHLLSFFMIRHKKEDVLSQLPKKQKIPIYFDMDRNSRITYDQMEEELMAQEEGIHQFSYLAKMKEALVDIKLDPVIQFIKDMLEVEDKLVIFTFHNRMYEDLMKIFEGQCVGINGSVAAVKRQESVDKFQTDPKVKLFIGQIQAASAGITLTASHIVIFTEWGQTPAQMEQATDRVHRIGQESDRCMIYYLVVKDTIDEDPLANLGSHYADIGAVMNGDKNAEFVDLDSLMIAKVKERKLMNKKKGVNIEYE